MLKIWILFWFHIIQQEKFPIILSKKSKAKIFPVFEKWIQLKIKITKRKKKWKSFFEILLFFLIQKIQ